MSKAIEGGPPSHQCAVPAMPLLGRRVWKRQ